MTLEKLTTAYLKRERLLAANEVGKFHDLLVHELFCNRDATLFPTPSATPTVPVRTNKPLERLTRSNRPRYVRASLSSSRYIPTVPVRTAKPLPGAETLIVVVPTVPVRAPTRAANRQAHKRPRTHGQAPAMRRAFQPSPYARASLPRMTSQPSPYARTIRPARSSPNRPRTHGQAPRATDGE